MDQALLSQHYSQQFNAELEEIRTKVLTMGGLVEHQLAQAIVALNEGDIQKAETVVENDYQVNAYDVSIDETCTSILARRQPTASDLRLVLAVIKTTADLERIGDEAKRVAKMAINLAPTDHRKPFFADVDHLGEQVMKMLHGALDAFARMNIEAALAVAADDDQVDQNYENLMRHSMVQMMDDPRLIPFMLDIMWSGRSLERIGDRCCNICEYVVYFVKGKDVRHTSLDRLVAELKPSR